MVGTAGEYASLSPLDDDAFVRGELEVAPREGDRRVGATWIVGEDGTTYWESYFDHERGEACSLRLVREGPAPCLSGSVSTLFLAGGIDDVPGDYFHALPAGDEVAWVPNERLGSGRLRLHRSRPEDIDTYVYGLYFDTALGTPVSCTTAW